MDVKDVILDTLEQLGDEQFDRFKWCLQQPDLLVGMEDFAIPKSHLDKANRQETVDKIVQNYNQQSVEVLRKTLKKIRRNDLLEKLPSTITRAPVSPQQPCTTVQQPLYQMEPQTERKNRVSSTEKFKDLISKSSLIHSGSPALYKLRPQKQEFGTLTRLTVGEKKMNNINKIVLLVGETGTGKSTLINTLFNYTMGVKFEDNIWFQIVEEEGEQQFQSHTSNVFLYEIFGFKDQTLPYSLTIIDTPGYGDTRGIEQDESISQRLLDLFRSDGGVHEINAVGLVLKATDNRLSDRLKYVLDSVVSLFGKNLEENIAALITHSDGRTPENVLKALDIAKIKCATNEKNQPLHFLFDNCLNQDRTETREYLEHAGKTTMRGMSQFKDFLEASKPQKLEKTVDVLNSRIRLAACIHNLQERISLIELKQTEIRQNQEALKKYEEEMKKNEHFTVEVDEVYKDKENISGGMWGLFWSFYEGAVTCKVCEENCHYPGCTMAWSAGHCEVMKRGRCTACTNKCPVLDHVKEKWIYVDKTRKVKKTETEMKEKYEKNKVDSEEKLSLLENLEKEMNDLTAKKDQCLEEAYEHVVSLEQIALNVDSLSTHVHLDFLIKRMKEKGDTEKVQKLEEIKSRGDEGTRAGLSYMFSKLRTRGSIKEK